MRRETPGPTVKPTVALGRPPKLPPRLNLPLVHWRSSVGSTTLTIPPVVRIGTGEYQLTLVTFLDLTTLPVRKPPSPVLLI